MAKVTLTFDNGPEPEATPLVLDCLARHGLPATFFVLGRKAAIPAGGELIKRALREGHRIGNHTWSHTKHLGDLPAGEALREVQRCAELLISLGVQDRLFRPSGGGRIGRHLLNRAVLEHLVNARYTCVLWNLVPGDYRDPHGWMERAFAGLRAQHWTLLVLHDLPNGAMNHLDQFLRQLKEQGHEFVTGFPPECTPVVDGRTHRPMDNYLVD